MEEENLHMDTISLVGSVFLAIVGCVLMDWHFRKVSERNFRRTLHAEVESYLKLSKRL